ncbi:hypothetical protein I4U23_000055 [Adineta vaga]|nr:hypothetical protein I4U23_000055 [Adineta vaga]
MTTPPHLDERSIFSYPPPSHKPSAKEVASKSHDKDISEHDNNEFSDVIECPTEIHCTLPDGLKVENHPTSDGKANWGLYASKIFPKHSVVYVVPFMGYVRGTDATFKLIVEPEGTVVPMGVLSHLAPCAKDIYYLSTYPALLNLSCDPSCLYNAQDLKEGQVISLIALRDLHPGDEITNDICLAAYKIGDDFIPTCHCRAPSCRGKVRGFHALSDTEKEKLLPYARFDVQVAYWRDKET